ncbi:MAG: aldehyde ferredoxin oxidoreductase family protein, partial [Candidatus Aminicenantes bacterium]|nr:aldehyde ferredoxin oxidoreductase family protein [Candidatus Aminicenantes bacterium]
MSYTGKCMTIDLSSGKFEILPSDRSLLEGYLGGKGLGFALLEKYAPSPDPLGPENPLIFVNGPFTGTRVQTSARTCLVTRSPLTGSIHDSHCGGRFGPRLKSAGYDYIFITGKSPSPVYLYITPEGLDIRDATKLWGKGIFHTNDALIEQNPGREPRVACIGPAGENLVRIACIGVDKDRQYGRGGVGAVMGAKNLKALVVDGDEPVTYDNSALFLDLNKKLTRDILNNEGVIYRRQKGTMKWIRLAQEYEFLPTRNFRKCVFDDFEKISSEACREELQWKDVGCFNCGIRCSKLAKWNGHEMEGPEYETTAFLGSGCEISSAKDVATANFICDDLGMDTISAGVSCSFAMECYEKGLVDDWNGLELTWGNAAAQQEFLKKMALREGVGGIFADGTRIASEKIGKGSAEFAINIFGMEISGVNPLGCLSMGVALSVADFGSHTRLWLTESEMGPDFTIADLPQAVAAGLDTVNIRNCMIVCDFVPSGLEDLVPVLNAATGFEHTVESLMAIGTRLTHLARRYNLRNGRKHSDDIIPERFFKEKSCSGFMRGKVLDKEFFKGLIKQYYTVRSWNE